MWAIFFFILDIICFSFFGQWLVCSTLVYLIAQLVRPKTSDQYGQAFLPAFLFLIIDFAMHERFGISLLFLLPAYFVIKHAKDALLKAQPILLTLSVISFFLIQNVVFYRFLMGFDHPIFVTNVKIFINLIIGSLILWGMQGNRSLVVRGRKVWTPNRMDASRDL